MAHDLIVRGGRIVDGTGAEPFHGDIAIDGDTIAAVGEVDGSAAREIDAAGATVTPGFVDLHTHFDAQAGWDPLLTPVSWHGVTTALFGNCGVTFAPCKPADREFLAGMMETVEDIPKNAILTGLPWDWESYGQYLDSIEKLDPAINITGLVGHCASRFYVMGERAIEEDASEDEIRQIAQLVGQSVKEGAVGFSTNRLPGHVLPDGRSIPGTFAQEEELVAISRAVGQNGGILQSVLNYSKLDEEMAILTKQVRAAGTRVLFSAPYNPGPDGTGTGYDGAIAAMQSEGLDVNALTLPRSGGFLSGLTTGIAFTTPAWGKLRKLDFDGRLALIQDEDERAKLIEDAKSTRRWSRRRRTSTGSATRSVRSTPATPARASTARPRPPAGIRWSCGSTRCWRRMARRSSMCASSTTIWRRSRASSPRTGYCPASATLAPTSARSWTPAGPASCWRTGIGRTTSSRSKRPCAA